MGEVMRLKYGKIRSNTKARLSFTWFGDEYFGLSVTRGLLIEFGGPRWARYISIGR
jgi:hypothetical protein